MSESKKSQKVKKIKNGVVVLFSDDEIKKKHTLESKKLLSIARRSRTIQPNEGKSKKCSNFFTQLLFEYRKNTKSEDEDLKTFLRQKFTKQDEEMFQAWLRENKSKFKLDKDSAKEDGILTEYSDQYSVFYEFSINEVLYDTNGEKQTSFKVISDEKLEYELFQRKLQKEVDYYQKNNMLDEFLYYFKEIEHIKFDISQMYDKTMQESEEILLNACYNAKEISENVFYQIFDEYLEIDEEIELNYLEALEESENIKSQLVDLKNKYFFIQNKLNKAA